MLQPAIGNELPIPKGADLTLAEQAAIEHLSARDPRLGQLIAAAPFPAYDSSGDVYYDLVSCLVDQQIHYRSTSSRFERLLDLFAGRYPHPGRLLSLPEESVLDLKISARKYQSLRGLAGWWLQAGQAINWQELPDEAVRAHLSGLAGVGTWTTEMILLFTLQRPDILPLGDYGLKKAVARHYGLVTGNTRPTDLEAIAQPWQPYRSVACRYLWAQTNQNTLPRKR